MCAHVKAQRKQSVRIVGSSQLMFLEEDALKGMTQNLPQMKNKISTSGGDQSDE